MRQSLENRQPFIVENGGGAFIPRDYFPFPVERSIPREAYEVIEFGAPYGELVETLHAASRASGVRVLGFHQQTAEEVGARCGLSIEEATLAKQREYDEPFEILDPEGAAALVREIEKRGKRWTRGGRFYHITGDNDKAGAVRLLTRLYGLVYGPLETIGLGDGLNDAEFLATVDIPVLVRSGHTPELQKRVPRGRATDLPGPAGWNRAVLEVCPE